MTIELAQNYDMNYIVVRSHASWDREIPEFMDLRMAALSMEKIHQYLHAADIFLIPKPETDDVVVSSTVFQCTSSLCAIVIPDVKCVELMDRGVVRYKDRDDLRELLERLINEEDFRREVLHDAESHVGDNSSIHIAKRVINLFESL